MSASWKPSQSAANAFMAAVAARSAAARRAPRRRARRACRRAARRRAHIATQAAAAQGPARRGGEDPGRGRHEAGQRHRDGLQRQRGERGRLRARCARAVPAVAAAGWRRCQPARRRADSPQAASSDRDGRGLRRRLPADRPRASSCAGRRPSTASTRACSASRNWRNAAPSRYASVQPVRCQRLAPARAGDACAARARSARRCSASLMPGGATTPRQLARSSGTPDSRSVGSVERRPRAPGPRSPAPAAGRRQSTGANSP